MRNRAMGVQQVALPYQGQWQKSRALLGIEPQDSKLYA